MALDNEEVEVPEEQPEEVEDLPEEEAQEEGQEADGEATEAEADEVVVTIGDEAPEEDAPPKDSVSWAKMRVERRETARENRELKKKLEELEAQKAAPAGAEVPLGEKPTLESCEYDTDKFEQELTQWHERKRQVAENERKKQEAGAKAQAAWQATLDGYGKAKAALKVPDYEEAEFAAQEVLSVTQQGVILSGADNPALVIYALGKNQKKAKELAAIADPVKFAFAVAKLEKDMKVTPKRTAPIPETPVRGNARMSGGTDETLERLREQAAKTGDMSKVIAYKRNLNAKKRA